MASRRVPSRRTARCRERCPCLPGLASENPEGHASRTRPSAAASRLRLGRVARQQYPTSGISAQGRQGNRRGNTRGGTGPRVRCSPWLVSDGRSRHGHVRRSELDERRPQLTFSLRLMLASNRAAFFAAQCAPPSPELSPMQVPRCRCPSRSERTSGACALSPPNAGESTL
jgi:hypothetical protein